MAPHELLSKDVTSGTVSCPSKDGQVVHPRMDLSEMEFLGESSHYPLDRRMVNVEWSRVGWGETGNVPNPDTDLLAPISRFVYAQTLDLWIRESTRISYS